MNMLIVPTPLFDSKMAVEAYRLCSHDGEKVLGIKNDFRRMNEAFSNPGLDVVEQIGIEPFTGDKLLFADISRMQLMTGLPLNMRIEPERLVCVIPSELASDAEAVSCVKKIRESGYQIAMDGFPANTGAPMIQYLSFIMLDCSHPQFYYWFDQVYKRMRQLKTVICNIPDMESFAVLKKEHGAYFTGDFYSQPVTEGQQQLSPVKVNALHLLNQVNQEDFDLMDIVRIIERDPYLTISLLKFINSNAVGLKRQVESIKQAVAILGQKDVRHWSTVALSVSLADDRPSEITKLSLVRAKFAENLATAFELGVFQSSLFMAGLFSLLDVMLEKPMAEAINEVAVDDRVKQVLLEKQGPFAPVMELIYAYERADWDKTSILMIQNNTDIEHIGQAYLDALVWYSKLLQTIDNAPAAKTLTPAT